MSDKFIPYDYKKDMYGIIESLNGSLVVPSTVHTYSVITEYIKNWFLSKFNTNTFKHIHIEGKHVFDDFRGTALKDFLKIDSPALAIVPKINLEYDRNILDSNEYGIDYLIRTGNIKNSVLRDFTNKNFVDIKMEQLEVLYNFIIKVETKAQQIDMYKYLNMAFPISHMMDQIINMDFHLPYSMILQIAKDAGYEIVNNKVVDSIKFLKYLNTISRYPVMYKYRTVNGNMEYFLRASELEIRIMFDQKISADDGERSGMIQKNFRLEFEAIVHVPNPQYYIYYSTNRHELILNVDTISNVEGSSVIYPIYSIQMETVPKINERGWNQYLETEYLSDPDEMKEIVIAPLFENDLQIDRVIKHYLDIGVDPSNFIEFKIYNGTKLLVKHTLDWINMKIILDEELMSPSSKIFLYMDTANIHEILKQMNHMNNSRVEKGTKA